MMGLFDYFDRTKEGPGVRKDEPEKPPLIQFFVIFRRKFWEIIRINILHSVLSIPAVLLAFFVSGMFFQLLADKMGITPDTIAHALELLRENPDNMLDVLNMSAIVINQLIIAGAIFLVCTGIIAIGPCQSGITFIMRNFSREEHAFLWSDYWRVAKKNLKQSIIVMLINIVGIAFFALWFRSWYSLIAGQSTSNILLRYAPAFMVLFLLIFIMMQIYIQQMLITFEFTIFQLYKNGFLLAMAMFVPNFGIIFITSLIVFASMAFNALIGAFIYIFILPALCQYIMNFYANGIIKKYLIMTKEEREEAETARKSAKKIKIKNKKLSKR